MAINPNYGRIKSTVAMTKFQLENNPAFQALTGLTDGLQKVQENADAAIASVNDEVANLTKITIVEIDTSTTAQSLDLVDYLTAANGMVVFKDISGNAAANNITLVGTVDGVVDPVMNTNYETFRAFFGLTDGLFHQW